MPEEPRLRIRGKLYAYPNPTRQRTTDPALIEQLTGLTHSDWRKRYIESLEAYLLAEDAEDSEAALDGLEEDLMVTLGIVGLAISRANPSWSRARLVEFMNELDFQDISVEGGDADPPAEAARSGLNVSENGTNESALPSSSDSDVDSKKSTIQPSSGSPTLAT